MPETIINITNIKLKNNVLFSERKGGKMILHLNVLFQKEGPTFAIFHVFFNQCIKKIEKS